MCNNKKLAEKVHLLKQLEREQEGLEAKINNLKNEIKEELTKRGVNELEGEDWKVTWNPYTTTRFDQSKFKTAYPDLYEQFKISSESRKFVTKSFI